MNGYSSITCLFLVIFALGSTEDVRMRTRRGSCQHGEFQHEGKTCCLCPKGYRLLNDCPDTDPQHCERCGEGTFLDHPNSDRSCQPCKSCDPKANMKVKENCSPYSNTVCGCQNDYYCDLGELCRACRLCDKCENGEKTGCTETNNTVCNDATDKKTSNGIIATAVLVPVLVVVVLCVFFIWKRKQRLSKDKSKDKNRDERLKSKLIELDLNPYLPQIADHLSWNVMKRVACHNGMNKATIDNHEISQPNNARERTYELLQDWSQTQGLYEAYPALIKSLYALKQKQTAEEIVKIVEEGQAKTHP